MVTKTDETLLEPGFLERIRAELAVTESELVARAIDFANRGTFASHMNFAQATRMADDDDSPVLEGIRADQYRLRSALSAIVDKNVSREREAAWRRIASGVVTVSLPTVPATYRYIVVEHFAGTEPSGLFAKVLEWLLDGSRPYGADLRQCQLASCGKFFFKIQPKRGRPQELYCTHEHMITAHEQTGTERMRRSRKQRAMQKSRRRVRR